MIASYPPHPHGASGPHAGAIWLDLKEPTEGEVQAIEQLTGLHLPSRDELGDIEQSARLASEHGILRLTAPVIAQADTDHPAQSHIGFVLSDKLLVTVRYDPLRMFDALAASYASDHPPASSVEAFTDLMEAFVGRLADLLQEARAKLDAVSQRVFRPASGDPRRAARSTAMLRERLQLLGRIGERISMIRESLLAIDRMVPFVREQARSWLSRELDVRLKAVDDDADALSLFEEHLLGKVQFLLDAVLGFINIEQNDIFKVLTIASVVGIFPTLVAGWYGMNFHNMPEYGWAWGYQFGIGMIVLSTLLPLLWFKWRGWL